MTVVWTILIMAVLAFMLFFAPRAYRWGQDVARKALEEERTVQASDVLFVQVSLLVTERDPGERKALTRKFLETLVDSKSLDEYDIATFLRRRGWDVGFPSGPVAGSKGQKWSIVPPADPEEQKGLK